MPGISLGWSQSVSVPGSQARRASTAWAGRLVSGDSFALREVDNAGLLRSFAWKFAMSMTRPTCSLASRGEWRINLDRGSTACEPAQGGRMLLTLKCHGREPVRVYSNDGGFPARDPYMNR